MTHEVYVDRFSYALGSVAEDVEAAATRGVTQTPAPALAEAGFRQHWVCSASETAYDLARRAVESLADGLGDVGAIVYATCIPLNASMPHGDEFRATRDVRYLMDFPASHLQADFGLDRATVIGLDQQACTGMLGSLRVARALLIAEPDLGRVLCVTADRFPEGALYEQSYNLISDGAAACIVGGEVAGFRILAAHGLTNGSMVMASGDEAVGSYFSYAHRVIGETLVRCGLAPGDVDCVVPQNTNPKAWHILAKLLGIDPARVRMPSIGEVGHVISSDNVINLACLVEDGEVRAGQRVLLFMAGYGLNWQCVVLERC